MPDARERSSAQRGAQRFRLLVFDWDGTLVDSTGLIAWSIQQACRDLDQPVPDEMLARHVIGLGLADALAYVAPGLAPERHPELSARYRAHYLAREPEIPLFDGVREMLGELDETGFVLAVATGKNRVGLDRALRQQGIGNRFAATRCADEGAPKPYPDMLLHLMRLLAVEPQETLMIGDTTHDLELARNAGASALAVSYGAHEADHFTPFEPLATVHSLPELHRWLQENA